MNPSKSKGNLRRVHRWLALIFSVSVLMSAGSGILHSIMSRGQSPPPPARPGGVGLDVGQMSVTVADAEARLRKDLAGRDPNGPAREAPLVAVNIRVIDKIPWYQLFVRGVPVPFYVNATTGEVKAEQDEIYACQIATEFLGGSNTRKTDYLTVFNREYINIFRILPVYRFDADDGKGTRVYVSTITGSVTRHTDNRKQWEADIFSIFHKWMFIPNKDIRDLVTTVMNAGVILVVLLGLMLFFVTQIQHRQN